LRNPGEEVAPGFPIIFDLSSTPFESTLPKTYSNGKIRAYLAEWITNPDNPMTARVIVNRLWQHHFGRGIVPTPSDFGLRGLRPTHPELLDWLATELVAQGWSLKKMHRLMLTTATYQQSSQPGEKSAKADPNNDLFCRMNRLRLEGEAVRDSLLFISGRLNTKRGGPGVFPPLPAEALRDPKSWQVTPDPEEHRRRSIYIFARRNLRVPFLESFDFPDSNHSCPKRERSTTATQALTLLNSNDMVAAAKGLAERLENESQDRVKKIITAFRQTLGRFPTAREIQLSREFLESSPWTEFCRALFNLNEFVYLD
jgi:hypothetical protein